MRRRLEVDPRALATLRAAVALLVLADIALRGTDLVAFYTDQGAFPRASAPPLARVLPYGWSGATWWVLALFLLSAAFAAMLLVGHRTRSASAGVFVLLLSLQLRNTLVLNSGDILLLLTAFWGLFLPWAAVWSMDAARGTGSTRAPFASVATAAILLQPVIVYATNAVFKLRSGMWTSGEAMRYAFVDLHTTPFGSWLARHGPIEGLGQAWLLLVLTAPLLLVLRGNARGILAVGLAGGHLGMLATMRIGLFPLVSVAALIPSVPPGWWDLPARRLAPLAGRLRTLMQFPPATDRPVRGPARPTLPPPWAAPFLAANLLLSLLALGFVPAPHVVEAVGDHDRTWAMFARPARSETWYAAPVTLWSGTAGDALYDDGSPWDAPEQPGAALEIRWRKYLERIDAGGDAHEQARLGAYLCQRWDSRHVEPALDMSLVRLQRWTDLDAPPIVATLGTFPCPQP